MSYPTTRLRRLRYNKAIRDLVDDTNLSTTDLIYPIFVCEGKNIKKEIQSMPGQYQLSIDNVLGAAIMSKAPAAGLRFSTPPATPARTEFLLNPHVAPFV